MQQVTAKVKTIEFDAMLLGWSETHNGGAKVTLQLADIDDLEPFKSMTIRKGKIAGQLLTCVLVETDGNGNPVPPEPETGTGARSAAKFPGGFCGLAVRWCADHDFRRWLFENFQPVMDECVKVVGIRGDDEVISAWCVKKICGISTRKELDTDDMARAIFGSQIRVPYGNHRRDLGLDD